MEETAEERRHAMAIMVVVVSLGGALVAIVARDARDRLGRGLLLNVRETRLVVEGSGNGHLLRAALLLFPCGPDIVNLLLGRLLDGNGLLPETEEAPTRRHLLRSERDVHRVGARQRATCGGSRLLLLRLL